MTDPTPPDVPVEEPAVEAPVEKLGPRPKAAKAYTAPRPLTDTIAIVLSTLVIPLPIFVGYIILVASRDINLPIPFAVLGVLLLAIVAVYVLIFRRERTLDALRLPLLILAIQVVMGVLILLFHSIAF
jgi:hypothetical protein